MPRAYTLTHSDRTGDLFLSIGPKHDEAQVAGLYTRLMRDESWRNGLRPRRDQPSTSTAT